MNKQRKVLITITYNEMGIIIDTKAEEVAQSDLQPTCNQLSTEPRAEIPHPRKEAGTSADK